MVERGCCRLCLEHYAFAAAIVKSFIHFFFFSSRRRHTRCSRDWSSDVCSSDLVQVALIDKSNGGDGLAVRSGINSIKDLKGKSVNVDGPGTVQHFMLSYILQKNGLSIQDVIRSTMAAQPAAQAFVTGQGDAAVPYEPYLSTVRANPDAGRILVTSRDYPVVFDVLVFRT